MTLDELEVLEPASVSVQFRGERLEIQPLTIGALPKVIRAARPVVQSLLKLDEADVGNDGGDVAALLMDLVEEHAQATAAAAALAIGRPEEWVVDASLPEFLALLEALVRVNGDFFGRLLASLQGGRARPMPGAGPMPSNSSSSVATG